jgi:transcriptional regulator with XRE-family HTH domain
MSQGAAKLRDDFDHPSAFANQMHTQRLTYADRHIGARIRERRTMMGMAQQQLARSIGVTYQQTHKYEHGLNRISVGRLADIARALAVTPAWFFEGLADEGELHKPSPRQRLCMELARNFALIQDEKHQEALCQMARSLAMRSDAEKGD